MVRPLVAGSLWRGGVENGEVVPWLGSLSPACVGAWGGWWVACS